MIPICKPTLPNTKELKPLLEKIDHNQWFSNFGPLEQSFRQNLAQHFHTFPDKLVTTANGTLALTAVLNAVVAEKAGHCFCPSWTFAATPQAICNAGLTPYFLDVDQSSWALDPQNCFKMAKKVRPKAIVLVSPFGAPLDLSAWEALQQETGIPVIIDAAAGFDTVKPSELPTILSFHATKVFGIGEGGLVICPTTDLAKLVKSQTNFGFSAERESQHSGTNAKLSEYAAAVGCAQYKRWPMLKNIFQGISKKYTTYLKNIEGISLQSEVGGGWASNTCNIKLDKPVANTLIETLNAQGIESRKWWENGCHQMPAFKKLPRAPLSTTEYLAAHTLALPMYADLTDEAIHKICHTLEKEYKAL